MNRLIFNCTADFPDSFTGEDVTQALNALESQLRDGGGKGVLIVHDYAQLPASDPTLQVLSSGPVAPAREDRTVERAPDPAALNLEVPPAQTAEVQAVVAPDGMAWDGMRYVPVAAPAEPAATAPAEPAAAPAVAEVQPAPAAAVAPEGMVWSGMAWVPKAATIE